MFNVFKYGWLNKQIYKFLYIPQLQEDRVFHLILVLHDFPNENKANYNSVKSAFQMQLAVSSAKKERIAGPWKTFWTRTVQ